MDEPKLLSIIEMGGYPDFSQLYRAAGYQTERVHSMRKAQAWLKNNRPAVVIAEFHFDPKLRDRMSNMESLLAGLQRYAPLAKVIVFIEKAHRGRLEKVRSRYRVDAALDYPIDQVSLATILATFAEEG